MSFAKLLAILIALTLCAQASTAMTASEYEQRSEMIYELLVEEDCPLPEGLESKSTTSLLQLKFQRQLYTSLKEKLFSCGCQQPFTTQPPLTPQPPSCKSAINLTESWRTDYRGSKLLPNAGSQPNCDARDMVRAGKPWFRFEGSAGNRILDHCVPAHSCGTHGAMWTDDPMPHHIGVTARVTFYTSWDGNCRKWLFPGSVMRCSNITGDFVYRHDGSANCSNGYCGMH